MADSSGEKIEVKTLKNTNLKPADLSKAIEDSTKSLAAKTKPGKTETVSKSAKTAVKTKVEPKPALLAKPDEGSQIIVKRKSSYMSGGPGAASPPPAAAPPNLATEAKVEIKPPSATGKAVVAPPQPAPAEVSPAPTAAPDAASPAPAAPGPVPPAAGQSLAPAKVEAKVPAQQALKTFDTNEYHLPIKPTAGNHYVNGAVAWTILLLVFAGVGGYVLNELEVIDLSRFGL